MDAIWVADIRRARAKANVAFFFKQWGGRNKKATGRLLQGRTWDEYPVTPFLAEA
jgi:protein gp37